MFDWDPQKAQANQLKHRVSFENRAYGASPLLYPPRRGEERIKAFPLDGERLDRGESLSHIIPFSFSAGVRKLINNFLIRKRYTSLVHHNL